MKVMIGASALSLSGCATRDAVPSAAARSHCLKTGRRSERICTPHPIPPEHIEAAAKRFEPVPGACVLYVVRSVAVDRAMPLKFVIDNTREVLTLPRSLSRIRLAPGRHRLHFDWDGETQRLAFNAQAGEVRFIEITGASTLWSAGYQWSQADPSGARERATDSRLIIDLIHDSEVDASAVGT